MPAHETPAGWRVTLAERPVHISAAQYMRLFGKPFSHPFLTIQAPGGHVISELHGSWKRGSVLENRLGTLFDRASGRMRSDFANAVLARAGGGFYPHCTAYVTQGPRQYASAIEEQLLYEGEKQRASALWRSLVRDVARVNDDPKPYYRYARQESAFGNCQTMLRGMLERVAGGLANGVPPLRLTQTGWTPPAKAAICIGYET